VDGYWFANVAQFAVFILQKNDSEEVFRVRAKSIDNTKAIIVKMAVKVMEMACDGA